MLEKFQFYPVFYMLQLKSKTNFNLVKTFVKTGFDLLCLIRTSLKYIAEKWFSEVIFISLP